jgi:hypothetical protein
MRVVLLTATTTSPPAVVLFDDAKEPSHPNSLGLGYRNLELALVDCSRSAAAVSIVAMLQASTPDISTTWRYITVVGHEVMGQLDD